MKKSIALYFTIPFCILIYCQSKNRVGEIQPNGQVRFVQEFPSGFVKARNIEVWLPPGYDSSKRYPVLYLHDGQNVFNPETSYTGIDWGVDEWLDSLIRNDLVREAIAVGIWNTGLRFNEYMPEEEIGPEQLEEIKKHTGGDGLLSKKYLRFIVEELKPFIDSSFSTLPGRDDTYIMGSSMGGLISLYALCLYPDVFSGAACLSTHWPALDGSMLKYIEKGVPDPGAARLYFDYGTTTIDSLYEPYQKRADELFRRYGYLDTSCYLSLKFEGAEHSEKAWRARLDKPLTFLLARNRQGG